MKKCFIISLIAFILTGAIYQPSLTQAAEASSVYVWDKFNVDKPIIDHTLKEVSSNTINYYYDPSMQRPYEYYPNLQGYTDYKVNKSTGKFEGVGNLVASENESIPATRWYDNSRYYVTEQTETLYEISADGKTLTKHYRMIETGVRISEHSDYRQKTDTITISSLEPVYGSETKGAFQQTVTSTSRSTYPDNSKHSDGYWYNYKGTAPVLSGLNSGNVTISLKPGSNLFTISGTVSDAEGDDVTVSATIGGVVKNAIVKGTTSSKPWSLQWNVNELIAGSFDGIIVKASAGVLSDTATYSGKLTVNKTPLAVWDKYNIYQYPNYVPDFDYSNWSESLVYPPRIYLQVQTTYVKPPPSDMTGYYRLSDGPYELGPDHPHGYALGGGGWGDEGYDLDEMVYLGADSNSRPLWKSRRAPNYKQNGFTYSRGGTKIESDIIDVDGTYPSNGMYGGYWYVKKVNGNHDPVLSIDTQEDKIIGPSSTNFVLQGKVSDADSDNVIIQATLGGVTKSVTVKATTNTPWSLAWAPAELPEGRYSNFPIIADDGKGGIVTVTYNKTILVDRTGPTAPTLTLSDTDFTNKDVTVTVQPGEDKVSGVDYTEYHLSTWPTDQWQVLSNFKMVISDEGRTTFEARSVDKAGNKGETASATVLIDRTGPTVPIIQITPNGWSKDKATVSVTPGEDALSGTKETLVQVSDGSWKHYSGPFEITKEGTFTVKAESIDQVGNTSEESSKTAQVDQTPPTINVSMNERSWSTEDIDLQLKFEDALSGLDPNELQYKVTNGPEDPDNWDTAAADEQSIHIDQEGQWYVHAKAADRAGNTAVLKTKALQLQKLPDVPQLHVVQADETSAQLEWTLPSGNRLADGYRYQLKNVTTGETFEIAYPDNSFIDTKLSAGKSYEYQVKAINHVGESAYSDKLQVLTLPATPAGLQIEKVDRKADQALVTIQPVESATSYRIIAKNSKTQQEVFNEVVTSPEKQNITNLEPGTVYDVSAAAINSNGQGNATHAGFLTLPDEPGTFKTVQIGETDIQLEWNGVDTAVKYGLVRDTESIYEGEETKYHDQNLESGSGHDYAVSATNETGFGDYSTLDDVWTLPAAVNKIDIVSAGTTQVNLKWPSVRGADGYLVTQDGKEVDSLLADATEFTFTDLEPGGTYELGIQPFNRSGSGKIRTVISSTIPDAPATSEMKEIQEQSAVLSFAPVNGATKYRVTVDGQTYDIADTELQVSGLTGGKTYKYRIAGGNAAGYGQELQGEFLTLPHMPNHVHVQEHTARSVTLAWDKPESATGYVVLDADQKNLGSPEDNEYIITDLQPGEEYTFYIRAKNASGESATAKFTWRTIPDAGGSDGSGVEIRIDKVEEHAAELSWGGIPGADGYYLFNQEQQLQADTSELQARVEGLKSATAYAGWTVAAYNTTGKSEALPVPAFETLPTAAYTVKTTAKEKEIVFEFMDTEELGHEIFVVEQGGKEVYRGEDPGFTLKELKNGTKYTFSVWTENRKGDQSEKKTIESTTLKPPAPPVTGGNDGGTGSDSDTTVDPPKKENPTDENPNEKPDPEPGVNDGKGKSPFEDLDQAFNREQIESLYERGIVQGTSATTFEPSRAITRVEFMSLIVRALDLQPEDNVLTFQDIDPKAWYIPELKTALKNGVAKGFSAKEFRPFDLITREQASKMLGNVLASRLPMGEAVTFKDGQTIAVWAKNEVQGLSESQLVTGYPDGTFRPKNKLTRAESAALIYRSLESNL